jgi:opacity protein-like surface antigen
MATSRRPRVLAAALCVLVAAARPALAQTVLARNAPPDTTIEVVLGSETVGLKKAGADGLAAIPFALPLVAGKRQLDANVYVDSCQATRRVVIVERGHLPPPPAAGCERRDINGVYWVREKVTLLVNVGGGNPPLLLMSGNLSSPPDALDRPENAPRFKRQAPTGLALFGGLGTGKFLDAQPNACGNVIPCGGKDSGLAYTFGAVFWLSHVFGVEASYLRPAKTKISATSETFSFDSVIDADVVTIAGLVAAPIGPVRLYAKGGTNYHDATTTTTERIGNGLQPIQFATSGFSWTLGVGAEAWVSSRLGLYVDGSLAKIKGDAKDKSEALLDDRLRVLVGGVRVRLHR